MLERKILVEVDEDSFSLGHLPKIFARGADGEPASEISDSRAAIISDFSNSIFVDILK